jgi:hypothetical protein
VLEVYKGIRVGNSIAKIEENLYNKYMTGIAIGICYTLSRQAFNQTN